MARIAAKEATEASTSQAAGGAARSGGSSSGGGSSGGAFRTALGFLGSAIFYTGAAGVAASAYYTYSYDLNQIKEMVREAKAKKAQVAVGGAGGGAGGGLNDAWLILIESYLRARTDIEKQVHIYTDPTCDRLLPDLRPEMKAHGIKVGSLYFSTTKAPSPFNPIPVPAPAPFSPTSSFFYRETSPC